MISFDDKLPIYVQIMDYIKQEIVKQTLKGGDKLPSVRELCEKLKVNPNTVQRAYQELEREGITYTQRGMGTFITKEEEKIFSIKKKMAENSISTFVNGMRNLGFQDKDIIKITSEYMKGENI